MFASNLVLIVVFVYEVYVAVPQAGWHLHVMLTLMNVIKARMFALNFA